MIYVEPRAGLCNRMRVIASAYSLAEKYNTEITVLWRISKGLRSSYYKMFKDYPKINVIETKSMVSSLKFYKYVIKCRKNRFINISEEDTEKIERHLKSNEDVYICTVHKFYDVRKFCMFRVTEPIANRINDIVSVFSKKIIGIHIRRADNKEAIRNSPIELFVEFIENEIKKDEEVQFYLATDSWEVEAMLYEKYGKHILSNREKILERSSEKGMEDALVDLGCLKECNMIVGSFYSSFSETAASWGNKELKIIKR